MLEKLPNDLSSCLATMSEGRVPVDDLAGKDFVGLNAAQSKSVGILRPPRDRREAKRGLQLGCVVGRTSRMALSS